MKYCRLILLWLILLVSGKGSAQDSIYVSSKIKENVEIDKIQQMLFTELRLGDSLHAPEFKELKYQLTNSIISKVDELQLGIETDSLMDEEQRIKFLTGLKTCLNSYLLAYNDKQIGADRLPSLISAYSKATVIGRTGTSIIGVLREIDYKNALIIISCFPYQNSQVLNTDRELWMQHVYQKYPDKIFPVLFAFPDVAVADSLISILARRNPGDLYTYSQAKASALGKKIHASKDTLVQLIAGLADKKEGRMLFPFTGSLINGDVTVAEIRQNFGEKNNVNYFKLLVKTQIKYAERLSVGDTAVAANALFKRIQRIAQEDFVNVMNGLHERPDAERFKVIESLSAQELYYICVACGDELYTSSYLYLYKNIFKTFQYANSYSLLQTVYFDHFKRFIKLASNFNTLTDFLSRMDNVQSDFVMKSFVDNLQDSSRLEDAVDVADSYASIQDQQLKKKMIVQVEQNLAQSQKLGNKTGVVIYSLLNTLFTSLDSAAGDDISARLDIPSVYQVDNATLRNKAGKIIIQEYFYGDTDGNYQFDNFLKKYRKDKWNIVVKKEWVELRAADESNVVIYANKPLDEITYKDIHAQNELRSYLSANNLVPTIVIHRGHSYFVENTIKNLTASVRIVILGSCGGYNNLDEIIKKSPYVHIISSKQEGNGSINQTMIVYFTKLLEEGKDLYWPGIWADLNRKFKNNRKFDDYIAPYKNLGAIFMMAYNKKMGYKK